MDERVKMLMLLNYINAGAAVLAKFLMSGAEARELWEPGKADVAKEAVGEKGLARLRAANNEAWAEREFERAQKSAVTLIFIEGGDYPQELGELKDAPLMLYFKGNIEKLRRRPRVGVVGTRRMSSYGRAVARGVGRLCAEYGMPLVSGGAWGVDGESQRACCENGGDTFAVLGTGVDVAYPQSNAELFRKISEEGALISEFPLGSGGEPWHFPQRNRIIAALSEKLVVVEAPFKSGSMITARIALELGREIWAVPGQIGSYNSEGTNRLIFDGAFPYISDEAFLTACEIEPAKRKGAPAAEPADLSAEDRKILAALKENGETTIDNLSISVKMGASDLLKNIALLSAKGLVFMSAPGRYSIRRKL